MESKLDKKALATYAEEYSAKLIGEVFKDKEHISGEGILTLPVAQVGLLILDEIYRTWSAEAEKLKSPYFNYEADEVKAGIRKLMNVLSRNILVARADFEPLLKKAVEETLLLALSPYTYYVNLFNDKEVTLKVLEAKGRFIKVNREVYDKFMELLAASPELLKTPVALLNEVFGTIDAEPQSNETIIAGFNSLHPVSIDNFYKSEDTPAFIAMDLDDDEEEEVSSESTLNDSFVGNSYETVADKLKNTQQSTGSLKSMLSINQKFMFINDLFDGNQDDFTKVLDFLETCETKEVAVAFIQNNYLKHNVWKENSPQVREFMELLDKKFS